MAAEVKTVSRVYIADASLARRSGHHTVYAGAEPAKPKEDQALVSLVFEGGIARDVPQNIYDLFHDLGHATTQRPRHPEDED